MKSNRTISKLTRCILVFTLLFSLQTSLVLAEDETTPEPAANMEATEAIIEEMVENTPEPETTQETATEETPVEETEPAGEQTQEQNQTPVNESEPAAESMPEQEATQVVESSPTGESFGEETEQEVIPAETEESESTPEETQTVETPTPSAETEPEISELLSAAEEAGVDLIPLDNEDEIASLGSNEAAEILSGGDPYFKDAGGNWIGYTSLGGTCPAIVTTCNQVATPVQAAIDAAPVDATIYVEKDTYVENIVINKSLTLTGLWQGNEDNANRPILQGSVLITAEFVYFENWIVDAIGETYGIEIQANNTFINNTDIRNAVVANVFVNNADDVTIINNKIENSIDGNGILVANANNTNIKLNNINNNGSNTPGGTGGISVLNSTNTTIYQNNITNNEIGIINNTVNLIDATENYFSWNALNSQGNVFVNTLYPMVSLPADSEFPPAPEGEIPDNNISPPASVFVEYYHPIDGDFSDLDCGMVWDANTEISTGGDFQRYVNDVWVRYDADLGGWIHDMGTEDNAQYLRKADGSWYILSNGSSTVMPNITDNNWSVLDGNWCLNPGGGHLMYEDCFLYYYENGNFVWALSTQDSEYYDYDAATSSWIKTN